MFALILGSLPWSTSADSSLTTTLSTGSQASPWVINVDTIANFDFSFHPRKTPFDTNFACDTFLVNEITASGFTPIRHSGPIAKRPPALLDDQIYLEAGDSLSSVVDLSRCFEFQHGTEYAIGLPTEFGLEKELFIDVGALGSLSPMDHHAHSLSKRSGLNKAQSFPQCSDSEITQIEEAIVNAIDGMANAYGDNLARGCGNNDFSRLFGVYTQERYYIVHNNFRNIDAAFAANQFNVVCGDPYCDDYTFAFVYPTDPDKNIYVCGAFWSAPAQMEIDSRPGTLIHEMSHFENVAGTLDHVYGLDGTLALAESDPCMATNNADSHEHYAELIPTFGDDCCQANEEATCTQVIGCEMCAGSTNDTHVSDIGDLLSTFTCENEAICQNSPGDDLECPDEYPDYYDDIVDAIVELLGWIAAISTIITLCWCACCWYFRCCTCCQCCCPARKQRADAYNNIIGLRESTNAMYVPPLNQ